MKIDHSTYLNFKENTIQGRYLINKQVIDLLNGLNADFTIKKEGESVEKRPIRSVSIGNGNQKILMWSQMHGNESTTTKAVIDLLKLLGSDDSPIAKEILENCTLKIIPILNPDGAQAYTRINANGVDLNRDAQERSQPESKILRTVYEDFSPDFCFNLHDQRTIFNVGNTSKPATVSFLAPSLDEERSISKSRRISMKIIAAMNKELQAIIPGQVGRYDDGFNANCIGDTFQMLDTPTILFEAGHFSEDYQREKTREYIFYSLLSAIECISRDKVSSYSLKDYFEIPENNKLFFDAIIKNAQVIDSGFQHDVGILFSEVLEDAKISFIPTIKKEGELLNYFGHSIFDCNNSNDLAALKKGVFWNALISKK